MARPDGDPDVAEEPAAAAEPAMTRPATSQPAPAQPAPEVDTALAEMEDRLRRALADADNARKRCERQVADARADERARVAARWLPIVDNLERALAHAGANPDAIVEGIQAIRDQAVGLLAALGYRRHDETGVPFDPQLHEAVGVVPDGEAPAGTVLQVLRPGYGEGTSQLRPAAVMVAGG